MQQMIEEASLRPVGQAPQDAVWEEISTLVQTERLTEPQRVRLRSILELNPALVRALPGTSQQLRKRIIDALVSHAGVALVMQEKAELQARDLGYGQSSALEKLLIDVVITTWLQWQAVEWRFQNNVEQNALSPAQMEYWDRRLAMAQNRYLRACETLARTRRLLVRTPVQINIAAQQVVSIQGDSL